VPVGDIENVSLGGPMMLSVPPSSLKQLVSYQNQLRGMSVNYATVWTRISFVKNLSFPMFDFDALAPLNDEQAAQVLKMLEHPLIDRILVAREGVDESRDISSAAAPAQPAFPAKPVVTSREEVPPSGDQGQNKNQENSTGTPSEVPPGVDPAQWAQFLAMQNAPQRQPRRGRPPSASGIRTPVVSPQPTDSAVVTKKQQAAAATQPDQPATPAAPAAPGAAISKLMDTIGKMV